MSELNFAVMELWIYPTLLGVNFILTTNNPCHLFCYHTNIEPQKHPVSRTLRGETMPWSTYFCFVAWQKLEQVEAGDTLVHSFIFPSWAVCETKWFTFLGTVAADDSPSAAPIFEFHRTYLEFPLKFESYEDPQNYRATLQGNIWHAQTFTPLKNHMLTDLILHLSRSIYEWPKLFIKIYTAPNDLPTGAPLSSRWYPSGMLPGYPGAWVGPIAMPPFFAREGTKYALVLHSDATPAAMLFWEARLNTGTYPRGIALVSNNGGINWTQLPTSDQLFQEWGTPFFE